MLFKQNLILDYYSYNILYPGILEKSHFINYNDDQHKILIEESKLYSSSVILEKSKYIYRDLGNIYETPFFKSLLMQKNNSH